MRVKLAVEHPRKKRSCDFVGQVHTVIDYETEMSTGFRSTQKNMYRCPKCTAQGCLHVFGYQGDLNPIDTDSSWSRPYCHHQDDSCCLPTTACWQSGTVEKHGDEWANKRPKEYSTSEWSNEQHCDVIHGNKTSTHGNDIIHVSLPAI